MLIDNEVFELTIYTNKDQWNPNLYDDKHAFVSRYGEDLIHLLDPKQGEYILDLGCGTGDIANIIHSSGANVTGLDNSSNMIDQAKTKYPDIEFRQGDATALDYENQFDAVFSNATLHWIKSPIDALNSIYTSLKSGGRFVAEFGGQDNVQLISNAIKEESAKLGIPYQEKNFPWYFPSIGQYTTLMEEVGFRVAYASHFDRPTPLDGHDGLRNWIIMFGKMMFEHISDEMLDQLITNVENQLKNIMFKEASWIADYKRIRVIGIKQ